MNRATPMHMQLMSALQAAACQPQPQRAPLAGVEQHVPPVLATAPAVGLNPAAPAAAAPAGSSFAVLRAGAAAAGSPEVCKPPRQLHAPGPFAAVHRF